MSKTSQEVGSAEVRTSDRGPVSIIALTANFHGVLGAIGTRLRQSISPSSQSLPLRRIEEMLLFAAKLVDDLGPVAQPWLDRMEREYAAATQGSQVARIRALLQHG
jgi:hypothetical protein